MFSGAVTSSPIKRKLRSTYCHSPDESFLSPDSSYLLDGSDSAPCSCRRSPRLLTNGYYDVTQGSFTWDEDGNVSLTPGNHSVSYKENLVRIFRRRRRPRSSLVSLLSDVTESCQSWLDEKVFGGVFRTQNTQDLSPDFSPDRSGWDRDQDRDQDRGLDQEWDQDWGRRDLDQSMCTRLNSTELEDTRSFIYDPTEAPPPPDKPPMIQEETYTETCQSQETFSQSVRGLSEVPPTPAFYNQSCCCQNYEQNKGLTLRGFILFILTVFIMASVYSGCLWWSSAVASMLFITLSTFMILTKSGPMGEWRKARTEDITSRNE